MDDISPFANCPECGKPLIVAGVMLMGNFLVGEETHPVWRLECADCEIIVAEEMSDQEKGWRLWDKQNQDRKGGR